MTRRQLQWSAGIVAAIALASGVVFALLHFSAGPGSSADVFFQQSFKDLDGETVSMGRWKDKVVVVNFWATWCPPCIEEMPDLQRVHEDYEARGVAVVGLGIDSPSALRRFRDEHLLSLPLFAAGAAGSDLGRALGNASGALPYTVLLDRKGRIVHARLGQIRPAELRQLLDAQIGK